jgi:hypothetical protein
MRLYGGADVGREMTIDLGLAHRRDNPLQQGFDVAEYAITPWEAAAVDTEMRGPSVEQVIDDPLCAKHRMLPA